MSILEAVILGIVQGLAEFLPISSSGHLVLLRNAFGISEPAMFFDIMVHIGTLLAVIVVLRQDVWAIMRRPFQPLTGYLILATIPVVIVALFFTDLIDDAFETGRFLGFSFLLTTVLLITAELLSKRAQAKASSAKPGLKDAESMTWLDALIIGIMQAVAISPGVSRSGATISAALSRKLNRDFAARFSFLLSIPVILGALVLQVARMVRGTSAEAITAAETAGGISAAAVIAGTVSAAVVGFFAVKFMLKIIRQRSLYGFAAYTAVLGILVLIDQYITRIVF